MLSGRLFGPLPNLCKRRYVLNDIIKEMKMKKYYALLSLLLLPFLPYAQGRNGGTIGDLDSKNPETRKELMVPTAFSPNNDGQNDYFKICNITDEKIIEFKVFNRWGTILFHTQSNEGWDGNFKGQPQPVGVYGYVIRIAYKDGYIETYKGIVTLLR